MTSTDPFRLIFKRSQTQGRRPTFSLLVSAEMTPEFEKAAREYGMWNEVIYTDPSLDESRAAQLEKAERKAASRKRRANAIVGSIDGSLAIFLLPMYIVWRITKFVYLFPFKLLWWLFRAFRTQNTQVMRFSELKKGKTITAQSLAEIMEAEEMIQRATQNAKAYVLAAGSYEGEAFDATLPTS